MDPVQAAKLGVDPDDLRITCSEKHNGWWIVWVPDRERGQLILTSGRDIYDMCWWRMKLRLAIDPKTLEAYSGS